MVSIILPTQSQETELMKQSWYSSRNLSDSKAQALIIDAPDSGTVFVW